MLPVPETLMTLDIADSASPFCYVPTNSNVIIKGMEITNDAQPFITNYVTPISIGLIIF